MDTALCVPKILNLLSQLFIIFVTVLIRKTLSKVKKKQQHNANRNCLQIHNMLNFNSLSMYYFYSKVGLI